MVIPIYALYRAAICALTNMVGTLDEWHWVGHYWVMAVCGAALILPQWHHTDKQLYSIPKFTCSHYQTHILMKLYPHPPPFILLPSLPPCLPFSSLLLPPHCLSSFHFFLPTHSSPWVISPSPAKLSPSLVSLPLSWPWSSTSERRSITRTSADTMGPSSCHQCYCHQHYYFLVFRLSLDSQSWLPDSSRIVEPGLVIKLFPLDVSYLQPFFSSSLNIQHLLGTYPEKAQLCKFLSHFICSFLQF